jgi:hypothetical protein
LGFQQKINKNKTIERGREISPFLVWQNPYDTMTRGELKLTKRQEWIEKPKEGDRLWLGLELLRGNLAQKWQKIN